MDRIVTDAQEMLASMKREYADVMAPLKQLEQEVLANGPKSAGNRTAYGQSEDGDLRNLKDRTQSEYFTTMINNLRLEMVNAIQASKLDDGMDVKDELSAQDLLIKQINLKIEHIQSEVRKIDRTVKTQLA